MPDNTHDSNQNKLYVSYQPAFEKAQGGYSESLPNPGSLQNVMLFYQFYLDPQDVDRVFAVPGGCIDIVFCCDRDHPTAKVCGSVTQGKRILYKPGCVYFGIRLLPGYDWKLLKYPAKEFVDREVPLNEVLGREIFIAERVAAGENFESRIRICEASLSGYISSLSAIPFLSRCIIEKIYRSNGQLKINELAFETGYSPRYISRIFDDCVGISPKLFSRIVRFQKVLGLLLRGGISNLEDISFMFGYYDQSHFLRECREFCLLHPRQLAGKE